MLGRLLELSIATRDILRSYEFYRALGFTGADAADTYPYRYGVLTDGRIAIGLHEADVPELSLTFVRPDLAAFLPSLRAAGLQPAFAHLSDERFHEIGLAMEGGVSLRLVEARTYSPVETARPSLAGWFEDLVLPVRDTARVSACWEQAGFVPVEGTGGDNAALTSDHLSLALRSDRLLARAALRYCVNDLDATRRVLDERGLTPDARLSGRGDAASGVALVAPEGTPLLLIES